MLNNNSRKLKIFLDPQIFYLQKFGGVSRIFAELWNECNNLQNVQIICPLIFSENLHLREYKLQPNRLSWLYDKNTKFFRFTKRFLKICNKWHTNFKIKTTKHDVFIYSYYIPYKTKNTKPTPTILTVFDMIHETFPHYFENEKSVMKNKKMLCEKVSKIIAISQSTKNDILKFYKTIVANKIDVVYLSQSVNNRTIKNIDWLPLNPYILFIGKRNHYKQFETLLQACLPIFAKTDNLKLVCAGGGKFDDEEIKLIATYDVIDKVIQNNFYDDELYTIYSKAFVFVFPSEYEGFGIPVLEAMTSGCPVILSKTSSLPEIGESAALYFNPNNIEQLTGRINELLNNEICRNNLIRLGYEQAVKFSWKKMTDAYINIIKNLVN